MSRWPRGSMPPRDTSAICRWKTSCYGSAAAQRTRPAGWHCGWTTAASTSPTVSSASSAIAACALASACSKSHNRVVERSHQSLPLDAQTYRSRLEVNEEYDLRRTAYHNCASKKVGAV